MEIIRRKIEIDDNTFFTVVIFAPRSAGGHWNCLVKIEDEAGLELDSNEVPGFDSLQSLMLSNDYVRCWIKEKFPLATWNGLPIDLAFPRPLPTSLGLAIYKKIETAVDALVAQEVATLEAGFRDR